VEGRGRCKWGSGGWGRGKRSGGRVVGGDDSVTVEF